MNEIRHPVEAYGAMEKLLKPEISELKDELPENTGATFQSLRLRTLRFFEQQGRRPRALVGRTAATGGTYPSEQLGALLAELGFDVDLQPLLEARGSSRRHGVGQRRARCRDPGSPRAAEPCCGT